MLCLGLGAAPHVARAQEGTPADVDQGARASFEAGRDAYDRGRFDEALHHFEQAYDLSPRPLLLFNIGRAAEADLQTDKAIRSYEAYLTAMPMADNREFVETRLAKLRALKGQAAPARPAPARPAPAPTPKATAPAPAPMPAYQTPPPALSAALPRFRIYGGARLAMGGEVEIESDDYDYESVKADLEVGGGLQVGAAWVWRYFGIGGELRYTRVRIENVDAKFRYVDLVVKPRGGYQLSSLPLEFYGALPIGVTVPILDDDYDADANAGFTVGLVAGATYFFADHLGANAELGWQYHSHSIDYTDESSEDVSFRQFQLAANFVYGF